MLNLVFRDISFVQVPSDAAVVPQIILTKNADRYVRKSMWLTDKYCSNDTVDAVCDITTDIYHSLVRTIPGSLCLHCAALQFSQGTYILPGYYGAGKSLLSVFLSSHGIPLLTDDAFPVLPDTCSGISISHYPRLRLPLPDTVPDKFAGFVHRKAVLQNHEFCFIELEEQEMPRFGTSFDIHGVVLLKRKKGARANLSHLSHEDAVIEIIRRNFAWKNQIVQSVDRILSIVRKTDNYTLVYDNLEEAAELLVNNLHN